jgi:hypothetical protein
VEAKVPVLAARHLYPEKYADVSRGGCSGYSAQNDASVYNEMDEELTAAEFLARFQGLEDQEPDAAAYGSLGVTGWSPCNCVATWQLHPGCPDATV